MQVSAGPVLQRALHRELSVSLRRHDREVKNAAGAWQFTLRLLAADQWLVSL
jgi:hypothetical protein